MKKLTIISFIICFLLSISTAAYAEKCQSKPYVLPSVDGYEHDKYAPDQRERIYDGKAWIASIDNKDDDTGDGNPDWLAQPEWVAYEIKRYTMTDGVFDKIAQWDRPTWYKIDLFDEERTQSGSTKRLNNSYLGVGKIYHRGHLAMRGHASMIGPKYGCNSHMFSNAVPQWAKMNTNIWLDLEKITGAMANKFGRVWIVAGPVFNGPYKTIGDPGEVPVAIPVALFKVIVWEQDGNLETMSFIFENKDNPLFKKVNGKFDHIHFETTLADVEAQTGFTFFSNDPEFKASVLNQKKGALPVVEKKYNMTFGKG